eukprot:995672-Rhodomonas_salina.1
MTTWPAAGRRQQPRNGMRARGVFMEILNGGCRNQYHQLQLFLEDRYPEHKASNLSYVMSVLGLYCQGKRLSGLNSQQLCESLRFTPSQLELLLVVRSFRVK